MAVAAISFAEALKFWFKLGCISFGVAAMARPSPATARR